jgi:hypothetical protein
VPVDPLVRELACKVAGNAAAEFGAALLTRLDHVGEELFPSHISVFVEIPPALDVSRHDESELVEFVPVLATSTSATNI